MLTTISPTYCFINSFNWSEYDRIILQTTFFVQRYLTLYIFFIKRVLTFFLNSCYDCFLHLSYQLGLTMSRVEPTGGFLDVVDVVDFTVLRHSLLPAVW